MQLLKIRILRSYKFLAVPLVCFLKTFEKKAFKRDTKIFVGMTLELHSSFSGPLTQQVDTKII